MSHPLFDLDKAINQINTCVPLDTLKVEMGKHVFKLEMITTIWHTTARPDYVFRVELDGKPAYENGDWGRAFFRPHTGNSRNLFGNRVFHAKPKWLPKDTHLKAINKLFDDAMMTMMGASEKSVVPIIQNFAQNFEGRNGHG